MYILTTSNVLGIASLRRRSYCYLKKVVENVENDLAVEDVFNVIILYRETAKLSANAVVGVKDLTKAKLVYCVPSNQVKVYL